MNRQSLYYFSENLPDRVPVCSLERIVDVARDEDIDRLEVLYVVEDGMPGFFVTGLVFLNKRNDEGYFFEGITDTDGCHVQYSHAAEIMEVLRLIVDETAVELSIFGSGDFWPRGEDNFFFQLERDGLQWAKQPTPEKLDISVIPEGANCAGCPYLSFRPDKPAQQCGYCAYLDYGDWMTKLGFTVLWDGLKECQVKQDWGF